MMINMCIHSAMLGTVIVEAVPRVRFVERKYRADRPQTAVKYNYCVVDDPVIASSSGLTAGPSVYATVPSGQRVKATDLEFLEGEVLTAYRLPVKHGRTSHLATCYPQVAKAPSSVTLTK